MRRLTDEEVERRAELWRSAGRRWKGLLFVMTLLTMMLVYAAGYEKGRSAGPRSLALCKDAKGLWEACPA